MNKRGVDIDPVAILILIRAQKVLGRKIQYRTRKVPYVLLDLSSMLAVLLSDVLSPLVH